MKIFFLYLKNLVFNGYEKYYYKIRNVTNYDSVLQVYSDRKNLTSLQKINNDKPFSINNLTTNIKRRSDFEKQNKKVSVIIILHNNEKLIISSITSIFLQSYKNIEVIIFDNASTDKTLEIVTDLKKLYGYKLKIIVSKSEYGISAAWNIALKYAKGDLVTFHSPYVWAHPHFIVEHVGIHKKKNIKVTISKNLFIDLSGQFIIDNNHSIFSVMIDRIYINEIGFFRVEIDDYINDYFKRLYKSTNIKRIHKVLKISSIKSSKFNDTGNIGNYFFQRMSWVWNTILYQLNFVEKDQDVFFDFGCYQYNYQKNISYIEFSEVDLSIASVLVLPLAMNSGHGSVKGGISPFNNMPKYFNQCRKVGNETLSINKFRHGDITAALTHDQDLDIIEETTVYLGPLHKHFGHFIVETLARLWFLSIADKFINSDKELKFVVLPECSCPEDRNRFIFADLEDFQKELFNLFGIDLQNIYILRKPTYFKSIYIPTQGIFWGSRKQDLLASQKYADFFMNSIKINSFFINKVKNKKIFIRRPKKYLQFGYVAGEEIIAHFFSKNGYFIMDPEEYSVSEQLDLLSSAKYVFGIQSSAFHLFNLVGNKEVDIAFLQRLPGLTNDNMIFNLSLFVNTLCVLPYSRSLNNGGVGTHQMVLFDSIDDFLHFCKLFDTNIDITLFNSEEYILMQRSDISMYTRK